MSGLQYRAGFIWVVAIHASLSSQGTWDPWCCVCFLVPRLHLHRSICLHEMVEADFSDSSLTYRWPHSPLVSKRKPQTVSRTMTSSSWQDIGPSKPTALSILSSLCFWSTEEFILFLSPARSSQYFLSIVYHCSLFVADRAISEHEPSIIWVGNQIFCSCFSYF